MTAVPLSRRAFLAASAAAVAACSSGEPDDAPTTPPVPNPTKSSRHEIAVVAPTSGPFTAFGIGIKHSVTLALSDLDPSQLSSRVYDSTGDPAKAIAAVRQAQANPHTIAIIGPVLASAAADLESILSADDAPVLHLGGWPQAHAAAAADALPAQVFSMAAPLERQIEALVFYCMRMRNLNRFLMVWNRDEFPHEVTQNFAKSVTSLGGELPDEISLPHFVDIDDPIALSLREHPVDAVFCAGGVDTALRVREAANRAQVRPSLLGLAPVVSNSYAAGVTSSDLSHIATANLLEGFPSLAEQEFMRKYDDAGFQDPWECYGPSAYDAATLIAQNLPTAITDAGTTLDPQYIGPQAEPETAAVRAALHNLLAATSTQGVTGTIRFDEHRANTANDTKLLYIRSSEWHVLH